MMTVLTQPDVVQAIEHGADDFVDVVMKPIADGYLEDCTELAWSHEVRACIADAADFVSLQTTCEPPPTLGRDRPGGAARGEIQIIDDAPRPAYTGSDESCASVGQHMLALQRPTEATLAQVPAERRAEIQVAMERSLTTLPESVEDNCEAMPWSLEERRCMLSATTYTKAIACTPHAR